MRTLAIVAALLVLFFAHGLHAETLFISVRDYLHNIDPAIADRREASDLPGAASEHLRELLLSTVKTLPLPHSESGYSVIASFGEPAAVTEGRVIVGTEIAAHIDTPVYAAGDGTVFLTAWDDDLGWFLVIEHGDAIQTLCGHLSSFAGKHKGDRVKAQEIIGHVGATGLTLEPALYFAVLSGKRYVNPSLALDRFAEFK